MINIPSPDGFSSYPVWAARMTEELADFHIAPPSSVFGWKHWATQLMNIHELGGLVPDPRSFDDWRSWAQRLYMNLD